MADTSDSQGQQDAAKQMQAALEAQNKALSDSQDLLKAELSVAKKQHTKTKKELQILEKKLKTELGDFQKQVNAALKSMLVAQGKSEEEIEKAQQKIRRAGKQQEFFDAYQDAVGNLMDLNMNGDQLVNLVKVLSRTNMNMGDFMACLESSSQSLSTDLKSILTQWKSLDTEQQAFFNSYFQNMSQAHAVLKESNLTADEAIQKLTTNMTKTGKALSDLSTTSSKLKGLKFDPKTAVSSLKAIHMKIENEMSNLAFEFNFDPETLLTAQASLAQTRKNIEGHQAEIHSIMASSGGTLTAEQAAQVQSHTNAVIVETAASQKRVQTLKKVAEGQREVVDVATEGYIGLASQTKKATSAIAAGTSSLKAMDLTKALEHFKNAKEGLSTLGKAHSAMGDGAEGTNSKLGKVLKSLAILGGAASMIFAIIKFMMSVRDKAASMNKSLVAAGGLAGLGFDLNTETSYEDMAKTFKSIRKEINAGVKDLFSFGIDNQELMQTVDAMSKQGVMIDELRGKGEDVRGSLEGVFTYGRLLGKEFGEMGGLMAKMSTNLSISMDRVGEHFAGITRSWQDSRIGLDEFLSTITDITYETSIFGDFTQDVSQLLGDAGKNALLGSKEAVESVKSLSGLGDRMGQDAEGILRGLSVDEYVKPFMEQMKDVREKLATAVEGSKEKAKLERQKEDLENTIKGIVEGTATNALRSDMASLLSPTRRGMQIVQATLKAAANSAATFRDINGNVTKDYKKFAFSQMSVGTEAATLAKAAGIPLKDWQMYMELFSQYGGDWENMTTAMAQRTGGVSDLSAQTKMDAETAKKLSSQLLTTEKMKAMAMESLLQKLGSTVMSLETIVASLVGKLMGKKSERMQAMDKIADLKSFTSKGQGSKAYKDTAISNLTSLFNKKSALKSEGDIADFEKMFDSDAPDHFKSLMKAFTAGDFSGLGEAGKDLDSKQKAKLTYMSQQVLNKKDHDSRVTDQDRALVKEGVDGGVVKKLKTGELQADSADISFSKMLSQFHIDTEADARGYTPSHTTSGGGVGAAEIAMPYNSDKASEKYAARSVMAGTVMRASDTEVMIGNPNLDRGGGKTSSVGILYKNVKAVKDLKIGAQVKEGDIVGHAKGGRLAATGIVDGSEVKASVVAEMIGLLNAKGTRSMTKLKGANNKALTPSNIGEIKAETPATNQVNPTDPAQGADVSASGARTGAPGETSTTNTSTTEKNIRVKVRGEGGKFVEQMMTRAAAERLKESKSEGSVIF